MHALCKGFKNTEKCLLSKLCFHLKSEISMVAGAANIDWLVSEVLVINKMNEMMLMMQIVVTWIQMIMYFLVASWCPCQT